MALYMNGVLVDSGKFHINGVVPDNIFLNGINMWQNKAPAGSQTFTASGTFTVPQGYTEVTICMCGGGGGGSSRHYDSYDRFAVHSGGGYGGAIESQVVSGLTSGQSVTVTVGGGGSGGYWATAGNSGASSVFNGIVASGGSGGVFTHWSGSPDSSYNGDGGSRSSCAGTHYDGSKNTTSGLYTSHGYGGQAGFGNGGNGGITGSTGGVGAGGGGANNADQTVGGGGNGGRGEVRVSWS